MTAFDAINQSSGEVEWYRTDWGRAAGSMAAYSIRRISYVSADASLFWDLVEIPSLYLCHKAALLLLQGQKLSNILIPNHELRRGVYRSGAPLAHVLLRVDPWDYCLPRPMLTGLKLARLAEIPEDLPPMKVLEILVAGSAT